MLLLGVTPGRIPFGAGRDFELGRLIGLDRALSSDGLLSLAYRRNEKLSNG